MEINDAGKADVREFAPAMQAKETEVAEPKEERERVEQANLKHYEIIAIVIVLSTIVLAGSVVYAANTLNIKLLAIDSSIADLKKVVSSGTAANAAPKPTAPTPSAQPQAAPVQANLQGETPRGDVGAPITIVEYSDFQCPFCEKLEPTLTQILKDYPGKVKIYYKHFPLTQIHQYAQKAAEASECAADQGKFWEYHDKLFENQWALDTNSLKKYAIDLGLDANAFNSCLDNGTKEKQVSSELQEGLSNGVQGTPASFVNGQLISGAQPYSTFQQAVESELARLSG